MKTTPRPKKAPAKPSRGSKRAAKKPARAAKKPAGATERAAKKPAPRAAVARRADYGAPIDGFFIKQPPHLRAILETLRKLIEAAAPDATAALKWGMPSYSIGSTMMCVLAGHKSHVNLVLAGPPGTFADPNKLLVGEGKTGRHLTLRSLDELPRAAVKGWLRAASQVARSRA